MGNIKKPNIFEYDNYRSFLKDLYASLKQEKSAFSFRFFSKQAGFRSPNFLKLVMDGKRNLSPDGIEKFARALKLNKEETTFFRNLVLLNQATTIEEKKFYAEQLIRHRFYKKINPLKQAQYDYYTNWYFIPVRELVGVDGFKEDPAWIAHQLIPPITTSEAEKALKELEQLGLIKRNEEGKLVQTDGFISTGDEVASASVAQFHREMMQKAAESIDRFPAPEREISSVTIGISEERAEQVKELIQRFRRELLAIASQDQKSTGVYQVNFQLFPLTKKPEGESS
ncbi:MAG: TIGR02147 family protein [Deltaproteobacteria bacterium]|nr:TIGR02147 family protein [Deltaproteobacteria bacterium]